jgi:hypothetical protein
MRDRVEILRRDLAGVGISLPAGIEVSEQRAWTGGTLGCTHKLTVQHAGGEWRRARVEVRAGLDPLERDLVLIHELTHARLHLNAAPSLPDWLEEGICEVVALVWLGQLPRRVGEPAAARLLANQAEPYATGVRRVLASVRAHGVPAVVAGVELAGHLP